MFCLHFVLIASFFAHIEAQLRPNDTGRVCLGGYFDNGNYCEQCPFGFTSTPGSFFCKQCPPGLFRVEWTDLDLPDEEYNTECLPCPAGYKVNGSRCTPCPIGSYSSAENSTSCNKCPGGAYTSREAAPSETRCLSCGPGHSLYDELGLICYPCSEGSYQDRSNQFSCIPCPDGTTSKEKQISVKGCFPCGPGFYSNKKTHFYNTTKCVQCSKGFYAPHKGASKCLRCPRGSKSNSDRTACLAAKSNQSGLQPCPPGFGKNPMDNKCSRCRSGTVSTGRFVTECAYCTNGLVPASNGTSCKCPPGLVYFPPGVGNKCTKCPKGEKPIGDSSCSCPSGRYFVPDYGTSECKCLPFTKELESGECGFCDAKSMPSYQAKSECNLCEMGEYFNQRKNLCVPCPLGYTSDIGDKQCRPCDITYTDGKGRKRCGCSPGQQMKKGKCSPCPRGTFRDHTMLYCERCSAGHFSSSPGQKKCKRCPKGRRYDLHGSVRCPPRCPVNGIIDHGYCQCDNFSIYVRKPSQITCKRCPKGMISIYNDVCRCGGGTVMKNGTCVPCPPGTVSFPGEDSCEICRAGIPSDDQSECVSCPPGTYNLFQHNKCLGCKDGTFHTKSGKCGRCKPGYRVRNGECVACVDSINNGGDLSYCEPCTNGTEPSKSKDRCV